MQGDQWQRRKKRAHLPCPRMKFSPVYDAKGACIARGPLIQWSVTYGRQRSIARLNATIGVTADLLQGQACGSLPPTAFTELTVPSPSDVSSCYLEQ
mmetsp:Transcript_12342/g.37819  ORF Transcript_12342/g.37819 Transcript_12342/m.37819 type:complete len:97 (+) Transcript_12342:386-676(+)|eukprot:scaffold311769_cov32-Tisochrysis_lutea.AAC.4